MVLTKAIGKLIMTDQTHQIPSQLQMGKEYGMQLMDQALLAAINAKQVDPEHAYVYASDKRQFQRFVTDMTGHAPPRNRPPTEVACRPSINITAGPGAQRLGFAFFGGRSGPRAPVRRTQGAEPRTR
jgi:hypothetical protein